MTPISVLPEGRTPRDGHRDDAGVRRPAGAGEPGGLQERLARHFRTEDLLRRGICLLNAGQVDAADAAFRAALELTQRPSSTAGCLIAAYYAHDQIDRAAEVALEGTQRDPNDVPMRIRRAWLLHEQGQVGEAMELLREGLALSPADAELQFQLGIMLSAEDRYEEAELRFAQVTVLRKQDAEAWVHMALCQAALGRPLEALKSLQRAQRLRPHDPHTGLLMTQALRAARQQGEMARLSVSFPPSAANGPPEELEELGHILERDSDFVDALLSVNVGAEQRPFYGLLLATLEKALERRPEHAELHYHCGRVLERLGRVESAIVEAERAVALDPRCARALIDLARWYRRVQRTTDAAARLEQVIQSGFEYADVYCQLGDIYREQGQIEKAGSAYRRALTINAGYRAARAGLEALTPASSVRG